MFRFLILLTSFSLLQAIDGSVDSIDNITTTEPVTLSTTTVKPTTLGPTTVAPEPIVPVYTVLNGSSICLMVQMNLKLNIYYFSESNTSLQQDFYINSSSAIKPTVSGACADKLQTLKLQWQPLKDAPSWELSFNFAELDSGNFIMNVAEFSYVTNATLFPDTNDTSVHIVARNDSQFKCPVGSFYQCMAKQTFKLERASNVPKTTIQPDVFLIISNLKAEAFRHSNSSTFVGTMAECSSDYIPNKVVPIVVGVALAVMIVIALITFIIGSRRRQAGYQEI